MQLEIRNNRDVWAGAMLIVTGAASVIIARDYAFGTSLRMGPGYFPWVWGGLLVLFGLYLVAAGLRSNEKIEGGWSLRALVVLPQRPAALDLLVAAQPGGHEIETEQHQQAAQHRGEV